MSSSKAKCLYVAATNQHVGKTTSTLGLVSLFRKKGINVGYCKPVGQKFLDLDNLRVDKDTLLFADLLGFDIVPELHSPVILGPGATTEYLDNPNHFHFRNDILQASKELKIKHEFVIFEGTGHPGVGSVADLSNADVAREIGASVIMIVEGGIGSTIDRLNVSSALFREQKVPILGVILNKVRLDKLEKVSHYVKMKLDQMGLPLLGVLPYDQSLAFPIMRTVQEAIFGTVIYNIDGLENKVEHLMAGSLIDAERIKNSKNNLLVVGVDRVHNALHKIDLICQVNSIDESPLAGIVATGNGEISEETTRYVSKHKVPLMRTNLDTYGSVLKISNIEVKINLHTPWKINRAVELINENVDLDQIFASIEYADTN